MKEKIYHHYIFPGEYNCYKYYLPIFKKEQIQMAMEKRALTLILRQVIGDQNFTW
jgi:hypothetical protein